MDFFGPDITSRVLANVFAAVVVITALYLLRIGYRYFLNYLGTGKIKESTVQYAELHTLLNNEAAKGILQFYFILKEPSKVKFVIVDKNDQELKVLIDENREPGNYPVEFNSSEIPNGIYFYQLHTDLQKISKVIKIQNPE